MINKREIFNFSVSILKSFIILLFFGVILPNLIKIYGRAYIMKKYSEGNSIFVYNSIKKSEFFLTYFYYIIRLFFSY